jgi:hypothetical protein
MEWKKGDHGEARKFLLLFIDWSNIEVTIRYSVYTNTSLCGSLL